MFGEVIGSTHIQNKTIIPGGRYIASLLAILEFTLENGQRGREIQLLCQQPLEHQFHPVRATFCFGRECFISDGSIIISFAGEWYLVGQGEKHVPV